MLRDLLPREAKGRARLELSGGATLADLLAEVGVRRDVTISVNGEIVSETGHCLQDGDEVQLFMAVGGGSHDTGDVGLLRA